MSFRGFHLRWWHWLLLVFVCLLMLVISLVLTLRWHGEQQYVQVLAGLKARGIPTTVDEMIANAPRVDDAVQERWQRWVTSAPDYPPNTVYDAWPLFVCGAGPVPTDVLVQGDLHRPAMELALQVLREGKPVLGMAGYMHRIPGAESRTVLLISGVNTFDFLQVRSLATWLRHQACLSGDPTLVLNDLDHLLRAGESPCSLLDAITVSEVAKIRDETYRDLALLGRLPPALRQSWLAEPSRAQEWLARGYDAEHALFNDAWAEQIRRMSWSTAAFHADPLRSGSAEPWTPLHVVNGTWMWCTAVGDCAILAEVEAHIAARLRRERTDPIPQGDVDRLWFAIGKITLPNLLLTASSGMGHLIDHRLNRLAVMLLDRSAGRLPHDEQELIARFGQILDLGGDNLRLRYERLADDRFRLVVDPSTPVPNLVDASMITQWSHEFGRPASARPLVIKRGSIELKVPVTAHPSVPEP